MVLSSEELKVIETHPPLDGLKDFYLKFKSTYLPSKDQVRTEIIDRLFTGDLKKSKPRVD